MKIIWDNNESAAPVAPLLLAKEEYAEELFDAMEAIEESEEKSMKKSLLDAALTGNHVPI
jgi:hypothetical protein